MNKTAFWTGVSMFVAPLFLFSVFVGINLLAQSGINWTSVLFAICVLAYVGTAIFLIIKSFSDKDEESYY